LATIDGPGVEQAARASARTAPTEAREAAGDGRLGVMRRRIVAAGMKTRRPSE
jgi:hypothetical protein